MNIHSPYILITEPSDYSQTAIEMYRLLGTVHMLEHKTAEALMHHLPEVEILVVRLGFNWNAALLSQAPKLRCIISPTTGLNHIDSSFATAHNIHIISLQGETNFLKNIPSTAEFTWGLLLACNRQIVAACNHVKQQKVWDRETWRGHNLSGKTLGIIGLGRVGMQVAGYAQAFGMQVFAYEKNKDVIAPNFVSLLPTAEEVLRQSDFISIHIPSAGNYHFLSAQLLSNLHRGATIINTSRGDIWDEQAVAEMVLSGHISMAATDVLEFELDDAERMNSPLIKAATFTDNILITPHLAGATFESMHLTENFVAQQFKSWFENELL